MKMNPPIPLPKTDYRLCFYDEGGIVEIHRDAFTEEQMVEYAIQYAWAVLRGEITLKD